LHEKIVRKDKKRYPFFILVAMGQKGIFGELFIETAWREQN
jgi:hypothetical protein